MIVHYLQSALAKLRSTRFASSVNVLALALGFACFVGAVGVGQYWERSDQQFSNAERIFLVTQNFDADGHQTGFGPRTAEPVATYLRTDFPELVVARVGYFKKWTVTSDDRKASLVGARADSSILEIFDFEFIAGDSRTALESETGLILTQSAATLLFGDESALGKSVSFVAEFDPIVTGVIADFEKPSHFAGEQEDFGQFDFIYKWPSAEPVNWWLGVNSATYVMFPPSDAMSPASLEASFPDFIERRVPADQRSSAEISLGLVPLSGLQARLLDLQLFEGRDRNFGVAGILLALGLLILLVATINYANLATALATQRAKEVGMRKTLGASQWSILLQHFLEAVLLTASAALLALFLLWATAPSLESLTDIDLRIGIFANPWPLILVAILVVVVALVASAYPVVVLSRIRPVDSIRMGTIQIGPSVLGKLMVALQFAAASALLIIVLVVSRQNTFIQELGLGANSESIVILTDGHSSQVGYKTLRQDLAENPDIESITQSDFVPWSGYRNYLPVTRNSDGLGDEVQALSHRIGYDYFETFGGTLIAGRQFDPERNESTAGVAFDSEVTNAVVPVVIDRALSESLGISDPAKALGLELHFSEAFQQMTRAKPTLEVIGVVEPMPMIFSAGGTTEHIYLLGGGNELPVIRIAAGRTEAALAAIEKAIVDRENDALVAAIFFDQTFAKGFRPYSAVNRAFLGLSAIAMAISMMGLVAIAVFIAARRRHEIGIRKTLGASTWEILFLLLRDFSIPVVVGNLIAWPLAYWAARKYLDSFMQTVELSLFPWILSLFISLVVAWLAVGGQAISAARISPALVLRDE